VSEATLGAKIRSAHDRWAIAGTNNPPGRTVGALCGLREKGVAGAGRHSWRPVRGDSKWSAQAPSERVRKLMKELEAVEPADPRKDLFTKLACETVFSCLFLVVSEARTGIFTEFSREFCELGPKKRLVVF